MTAKHSRTNLQLDKVDALEKKIDEYCFRLKSLDDINEVIDRVELINGMVPAKGVLRRKQILNMADSIDKIEGAGKISMDVFLCAGFNTIGDLKEEGAYAQRIQQAIDAYPFIPSQYMCTITFVWMEDLVIRPLESLMTEKDLRDGSIFIIPIPIHVQSLTMDHVYTNRNLKDAIEHYRNNFLHFSIPLTNYLARHAEVKRAVVTDSEVDDETDSEEDESDEVDESRIQ
ncbi:unnamed protein product [Rhizophagus irregularis]|nr:unnamed protein product [Rhizophagus irregularis]